MLILKDPEQGLQTLKKGTLKREQLARSIRKRRSRRSVSCFLYLDLFNLYPHLLPTDLHIFLVYFQRFYEVSGVIRRRDFHQKLLLLVTAAALINDL